MQTSELQTNKSIKKQSSQLLERLRTITALVQCGLHSFLLNQFFFADLEDSKLYRWIFPYDLRHPHTLTIVGLFPEKGGSGFTQIEIQVVF